MSFGTLQRRLLGPIIPILRVQGPITHHTADKFEASLANFSPERAQAVAILVNSPGGLIAPCQSISEMLRIFKKKHNLPIYTFAECEALSGGYWVLSSGDRVYADSNSWVGSIGVITQYAQASGFLKKHGVDVKAWKSNDVSLMPVLDPLVDVKDKDAKKILESLTEFAFKGFVNHVESYRDRKITVPKEERAKKLFQGDIWTGKEAADLGLVDNLGTFQDVLSKEFPDAKLVEANKLSYFEKSALKAGNVQGFSNWDEKTMMKSIANAIFSK